MHPPAGLGIQIWLSPDYGVKQSMHPSTPRLSSPVRHRLSIVVLLVVLGLAAFRGTDLSEELEAAARTRGRAQNDDQMLRLAPLLGPEYPIYERIQRDFPRGTPISVPWPGGRLARRMMHGFWFALLPHHPIVADAPLVIRRKDRVQTTDEVLVDGRRFTLVRQSSAQ